MSKCGYEHSPICVFISILRYIDASTNCDCSQQVTGARSGINLGYGDAKNSYPYPSNEGRWPDEKDFKASADSRG